MRQTQPSFVRTPANSFHPMIDGEELARVLASAPIAGEHRDRVMGPFDLYMLEHRRLEHGLRSVHAVAADCFIWGTGEPDHRALTKLCGLPYLPTDLPWPERDGTTGDFYGQMNFLDSKDLVPELPGDVLLVFRFHDLDWSSWDERLYQFLWVDVVDQELVRTDQVRRSKNGSRDPWPAMHAYRMRSFDDPSQTERVRGNHSIEGGLHNALVTKIGGLASDVQSICEPEVPDDWQFLGQFTGLYPAVDAPYQVVNRPAPIPDDDSAFHDLSTGPGDGITCLYLDAEDSVRVSFSCA